MVVRRLGSSLDVGRLQVSWSIRRQRAISRLFWLWHARLQEGVDEAVEASEAAFVDACPPGAKMDRRAGSATPWNDGTGEGSISRHITEKVSSTAGRWRRGVGLRR